MAKMRIWFGAILLVALSCTSAHAMTQAQKQALLRNALQNAHATQFWMSFGIALVDAAGNLTPEAKPVVAQHVKADLTKMFPEMLDSVAAAGGRENIVKRIVKVVKADVQKYGN